MNLLISVLAGLGVFYLVCLIGMFFTESPDA